MLLLRALCVRALQTTGVSGKPAAMRLLLCLCLGCSAPNLTPASVEQADDSLNGRALDAQIDDALDASTPANPKRLLAWEQAIEEAYAAEDDGSIMRSGLMDLVAKDGVKLSAMVMQPREHTGKLPVVVFINSWTLDRFEYLVPAAKLAKRGYLVLSYATRGFGRSGGMIDTAGPKDMSDLSVVLDWLEANPAVDRERIGVGGISYGAGIALLGLSTDPRIKVACSMSGWGSLRRSLYGNDTPRLAWGLILIGSGYFTGHMDPTITDYYRRMLRHEDIALVTEWADARSPLTYRDALNAANKPLYMSNNMQDFLFNSNGVLDYFSGLTVPKKLDLNEGVHASAEGTGLFGLDNAVWNNAYAWFDHYLRGIDNGITETPVVSIQRRFSSDRVALSNWPAKELSTRTFELADFAIFSGEDTVATTGIPILSDVAADYTPLKVHARLGLVNPLHGEVFISAPLDEPLLIRGPMQWSARLRSTHGEANLNLYFYDVDEDDRATLITHGTGSVHEGGEQAVSFDLMAVAHDIAPGHRIALAADTFDLLYAIPTLMPYRVQARSPALSISVQSTSSSSPTR